jgi:CheY-like chemotaxis protein
LQSGTGLVRQEIFFCRGHEIFCRYGMRVLIADDEKGFSNALADLVRSCGHDVISVVHSGLDAIRSYRQHRPDMVLMDFAMAKLNGLTACRHILSGDPDGCILFLSGSGLGDHSGLAPESSGALAVLEKPINRARLEQALNNVVIRKRSDNVGLNGSNAGATATTGTSSQTTRAA